MQANASYQNATYMNTLKCNRMHLYAACEECKRRKCNENVKNALECNKMHKNAYGKKPHHFREKTPLIPGPTFRDLSIGTLALCALFDCLGAV